jgi:hypothetical protein
MQRCGSHGLIPFAPSRGIRLLRVVSRDPDTRRSTRRARSILILEERGANQFCSDATDIVQPQIHFDRNDSAEYSRRVLVRRVDKVAWLAAT